MRGQPKASSVLKVMATLGLGAGLAMLWLRLFPGQLPYRTDIVGYPILRNFNVVHYFHVYDAMMLVFPLATLGAFGTLEFIRRSRRTEGLHWDRRTTRRHLADELPNSQTSSRRAHVMRTALVGLVFGIEGALATEGAIGGFWPTVLVTATAYLGIVGGIASTAAGQDPQDFWRRHAVVNALATPLVIVGLYGASRATQVTVLSGRTVDRYPWVPLVVVVVATAAAFTWVSVRIVRARDTGQLVAVERQVVLFLACTALLFLLVAQLPGALGYLDLFHEGESLAGARLVESGRFPWRDLALIHGPLQDVFSVLPGVKVFQESRWGAAAGFGVLVRPAVAVGFYLLHARLFRGNWVILPATAAIVTLGLDSRWLLFPFGLLLLIGLLNRPSRVRAIALAAVLLAQSILTPEAAPFSLAAALVLPFFEIYYRHPDRKLLHSLSRTLWFGVSALTLVLGWVGYLASRGALGDFVGHYVTFARGHELTGGVPIQWGTGLFFFAVVAPVASVLLFVSYFVVQMRRDRLRAGDWAVAALALYVTYFYRKFLSRADDHVFQVLAISVPLIAYIVYRLAMPFDRSLVGQHRRRGARATVFSPLLSLALLLGVLVGTPNNGLGLVESLPGHFRATAPRPPWLTSLGYSTDETLDRAGFEDLRTALRALPNPSGRIFDFTNQPAMFHYLLKYQPSTRYYHVSMAIRRPTQDHLLRELRKDPPGIVVFHAAAGLPSWDGVANAVRHYEVSEYLLDQYRPVIIAGGNLIMLRNDLDPPPGWPSGVGFNTPPMPGNPYFYGLPCDWGYAPNFLEVHTPPEETGSRDLEVRRARVGRRGVEFDLPSNFRAYDWLEVRTGTSLKVDAFSLRDRLGVVTGTIIFRTLEEGARRYLVRVGSCPQWHGFRRGPLLLLHQKPQDIVAVRLLRSGVEGGSR
jgi:hypothetical protein